MFAAFKGGVKRKVENVRRRYSWVSSSSNRLSTNQKEVTQLLESAEASILMSSAKSRATLSWPVGDASRGATTLRQVLHSESLRVRFLERAKEARAEEGVSFLITYFTTPMGTEWREKDVKKLVEEFLMPDSPHLITCLSGRLTEEVTAALRRWTDLREGAGIRGTVASSKQRAATVQQLGLQLDLVAKEVFIDVKRSHVFRAFIWQDEEAVRIAKDANVLDELVCSAPFLAVELLSHSPNNANELLVNMLDFCIRVDESGLDVTSDRPIPKIVLAKLQRIVQDYVRPGSKNDVRLPEMYHNVQESQYVLLRDARAEILHRLAADEYLMNRVREVKAQLSPMNISRRVSVRSSSLMSESRAATEQNESVSSFHR